MRERKKGRVLTGPPKIGRARAFAWDSVVIKWGNHSYSSTLGVCSIFNCCFVCFYLKGIATVRRIHSLLHLSIWGQDNKFPPAIIKGSKVNLGMFLFFSPTLPGHSCRGTVTNKISPGNGTDSGIKTANTIIS